MNSKPAKKISNTVKAELDIVFYKEGKFIVSFCPALQLSAYGKTDAESHLAMREMLEIYFEETARKGSLEKDLIRLGWVLQRQQYTPPTFSHRLVQGLTTASKQLRFVSERVSIPA